MAGVLNVAVIVRTTFRQPRSEGACLDAYALTQGNVGRAHRQRTQVTMLFVVFMGVGLVEGQRQPVPVGTTGGFGVSLAPAVATAEPAVKSGIEDHDSVFPQEKHDHGFVYWDQADNTKRA